MATIVDKFNIFSQVKDDTIKCENYIKYYLDDKILCHYSIINNNIDKNQILYIVKNYLRGFKINITTLSKKFKISSDDITKKLFDIKTKINYLIEVLKLSPIDIDTLQYDIIMCIPAIKNILKYEINKKTDISNFISYFKNNFNIQHLNKMMNSIFYELKPDMMLICYDNLDDKYLHLHYLNKLLDYMILNKSIYKNDTYFYDISEYIINYVSENKLNQIKNIYDFVEKYKYKIVYLNNIENFIYLLFNETLLSDYNILIKLFKFIFSLNNYKYNDLKNNIMQSMNNYINEDIICNLVNIVNSNIINNINNEYIYEIISKTKYTELFLNLVQLNLLKRYIYTNYNNDIETENYNYIKKHFNKKDVYKYNSTLARLMDTSILQYLHDYNEPKYIDIGVNIWPLNTTEGYYTSEGPSGIFNYYLHIGRFEFEFSTNHGIYMITSLPIHFYIIKNIINNNKNEFTNYNPKYIQTIIEQLLSANIIKHENNKYIINKEYNGGNIDLIDYEGDYKKSVEKIKNEIAHDEKHIIISNISSILKLGELDDNTLYNRVKDKVNNYINFDEKKYKDAINEMVDKNYVKFEDCLYFKYIL